MISYIKGGIQVKGIWIQDPEASICAQKDRMGVAESFAMRNAIVPFI